MSMQTRQLNRIRSQQAVERSALERSFDFYAKVYHLPPGESEYHFAKEAGRAFRFDRAWPTKRVAVELEGGVYSGGRHVRGKGYETDCEKYGLATSLGWRLFRFTGKQLRSNPRRCIEQVRAVLESSEAKTIKGDPHATQAAIRARYSEKTARQMGLENLSKPDIPASSLRGASVCRK